MKSQRIEKRSGSASNVKSPFVRRVVPQHGGGKRYKTSLRDTVASSMKSWKANSVLIKRCILRSLQKNFLKHHCECVEAHFH